MAELIPVNIVIGDRTYRLKIEPADEETVRRTVKLINDKILEFKTNFAGKDMQDYIAMVLIWFATEQIKSNGSLVNNETAMEQLNAIESLLDKTLSGK
ncbi:MAG: cell division protein ZapA [Ilyomonas sp.]